MKSLVGVYLRFLAGAQAAARVESAMLRLRCVIADPADFETACMIAAERARYLSTPEAAYDSVYADIAAGRLRFHGN